MRGRGARKGRRGRRWRASILIGSVVGALVVADAIALWVLWPDWDELARGPIPESRFIADYRAAREGDRSLSRLQ